MNFESIDMRSQRISAQVSEDFEIIIGEDMLIRNQLAVDAAVGLGEEGGAEDAGGAGSHGSGHLKTALQNFLGKAKDEEGKGESTGALL